MGLIRSVKGDKNAEGYALRLPLHPTRQSMLLSLLILDRWYDLCTLSLLIDNLYKDRLEWAPMTCQAYF